MSWLTVMRRAGVAEAALLTLAAAGLRDLEAGAMAVGVAVCLGLSWTRLERIGLVLIALLSANVAFWMGAGAVSNVAHGEGAWETALPSALTVTAVLTIVSAVATLANRNTGAGLAQIIAVAVLAIALVASVVGVGDSVTLQRGDIAIVTEHVKFSDDAIAVDAGDVGVHVSNKDLFWHTFTITELEVNLNVPVGAERRITFDAGPGTYRFICAIPGHTQTGMEGTLTVR